MTTLTPHEFSLPPLAAFKFVSIFPGNGTGGECKLRSLGTLHLPPSPTPSPILPQRRLATTSLSLDLSSVMGYLGIEIRLHGRPELLSTDLFGCCLRPELILKTLEWGLAVDRKPYQWIGFDGMEEKDHKPSHPDGTTKLVEDDVGETGRPAVITAAHAERAKKRDSPATIILSSLHLWTAMRGIGYAFGPPAHALAAPPPRSPRLFIKYTLSTLLKAHIGNVIAIMIIINRDGALPRLLQNSVFPFLSRKALVTISHLIAYAAVPISLQFQMVLGLSGVSLVFFAFNHFFRFILPRSLRPAPFDSREWPSLFNRPFVPKSVASWWSSQWHHLFRKPFTFVGYDPVVASMTPLVGKPSARLLGAFVVFWLSGWLHDQGMWSATRGIVPTSSLNSLTFIERWGAWIFFMAQPIAVGLEGTFTRMTGKKFSGTLAMLWSYGWIVGVGLLAGKSWIAMGLVRDLPPVPAWGWQRFLLPSAVLAPPPLWTK
ncbi:hypothetical protein P7C70_g7057, partial [Phenoliferia sp. Uapishka_3]